MEEGAVVDWSTDKENFCRVLGNLLREARKVRGWVRREVIPKLDNEVSTQTLATYELGTRHITMLRFVEICLVLNASPMDLLRCAYEQVFGVTESPLEWTIDLVVASEISDSRLIPLRNWARVTLKFRPSGEPVVKRFPQSAIDQLAIVCGLNPLELVERLRSVMPSDTLCGQESPPR